MGQILELVPVDVAGWMAVVAGFIGLALVVRWLDRTRNVVVPNAVAGDRQVCRFETGAEFQKMMDASLAEIIRAPDLRSIQAHASTLVDAADHAVNRLRADCAMVTGLITPPAFEPVAQLKGEPAAPPAQQQPLAA
jgi:hypothetical protein